MISFNNLEDKDKIELLLTESELGTLELQYIASQHGAGETPLLKTCVKLLYRNQILEKENKILKENAEHNDKVIDKANWDKNIYKLRISKALNFLLMIMQMMREQPSKNIEDNNWLLDRLENIKNILQGSD